MAIPDDITIERYMRGECHIHAIASVQLHGGRFAIAYDDSDIYYEDEDVSVSSVIHVWSIHDSPNGMIARDVLGDIPCNPDLMKKRLTSFFPDLDHRFEWRDAWIDLECTLDEVMDLSGNEDHQPLFAVDSDDIAAAILLPSVTALPGENPAPEIDDGEDIGSGPLPVI